MRSQPLHPLFLSLISHLGTFLNSHVDTNSTLHLTQFLSDLDILGLILTGKPIPKQVETQPGAGPGALCATCRSTHVDPYPDPSPISFIRVQ